MIYILFNLKFIIRINILKKFIQDFFDHLYRQFITDGSAYLDLRLSQKRELQEDEKKIYIVEYSRTACL